MRIKIDHQEAKVCRLAPHITGHLAHQGALTVDDLIMRKGQDEVLRVRIDHAEGQVVMVKLAMHGFFLEVL